MRKLITLNEEQSELIDRLKRETFQTSLGGLLIFLAINYEQNKRRAVGRPKSSEDDADDDDDGEEIYEHPYKYNKQDPYSYNQLVEWYKSDGKPMPPKDKLIIWKRPGSK